MPTSLIHMAYGRAYRQGRPELNERELLRGTVFPDVRRLAGVARHLTHSNEATLADADKQADAWQAGWWLHSYQDLAWNKFFIDRGLVANKAMSELKWLALKFLEEVVVFEAVPAEERERLAGMLEGPLTEHERASEADNDKITHWYSSVAWRLRNTYEPASWGKALEEAGIGAGEVRELVKLMTEFRKQSEWLERLEELRREFGY
jgi:hypothetical protein